MDLREKNGGRRLHLHQSLHFTGDIPDRGLQPEDRHCQDCEWRWGYRLAHCVDIQQSPLVIADDELTMTHNDRLRQFCQCCETARSFGVH